MSVVWLAAESFNTPRAALIHAFIGTDLFEWNIGWDVTVALSESFIRYFGSIGHSLSM